VGISEARGTVEVQVSAVAHEHVSTELAESELHRLFRGAPHEAPP